MTAVSVDDALDTLSAECERLRAENVRLREQRDAARAVRDTAQAQVSYYRHNNN
jgi:hypothetical protein